MLLYIYHSLGNVFRSPGYRRMQRQRCSILYPRSPALAFEIKRSTGMTDEPKNRINMEKGRLVYEQTRARLASHPASGKTTIRAVAKLLEDMHIEGRVGKFRLESDEPAVRGGTELGPTPLQYFIAGAAFCLLTQMARFAPLYDVPLEEVQADVRAEFDIADKF